MHEIYRRTKSRVYSCLVVILLLTVLAIGSTVAEPPGQRLQNILSFGVVWLIAVLLWLCFVREFIRHRLVVSDDAVEVTGFSGTERIRLDEISEAQWRVAAGGGYLHLQGSTSLLTVDFSKYPLQQGRSLIRFFRSRLPMSIQTGWEKYWATCWRHLDRPVASDGLSVADKTRRIRRRLDLFWGLCTLAVLPAIVAASWQIGPVSVVPALLLPTFLWLFFRFALSPPGQVAERFQPPTNRIGIIAVGGLVLVMGLLMTWIAFNLPNLPVAQRVLALSIVLLVITAIWSAIRQQSRRKADRQQAARMAAKLYLQEPS